MAAKSKLLQRTIGLLVLAALLSTVISANAQSDPDVIYCYYAHTSGPAEGIEPGEKVQKGEIIGYSGKTGFGTGPHLHFACSPLPPLQQQDRMNPDLYWDWIDPDPSKHAGWGNPLASMRENGAPFGGPNPAGKQKRHNGRDYRASVGTPLYAVADGEVIWTSWWPTWSEASGTGHGITLVLKITNGAQSGSEESPSEEEVYQPRLARGDPIRDSTQPLAPMWRKSPSVWWWRNDIYRWGKEYNLNPNIIATIMQIESGGLPTAGSGAGALGLFQVVPRFHLDYDEGEVDSDLYDPDFNARKGLTFYNSCLARADNDPIRAAACYNGGASQLAKSPAYWPDETKSYTSWFSWVYDAFNAAETNRLFEQHASGCSRPGGLCTQAVDWQYAHPRDDNEPGGVAPEMYEGAPIPEGDNSAVFYDGKKIVVDAPPFMVFLVFYILAGLLAWLFGKTVVRYDKHTGEQKVKRVGLGYSMAKILTIFIVVVYFPLNFGRIFTAMDTGIMAYNNVAFSMRQSIESKTKLVDEASHFISDVEEYLPDGLKSKVEELAKPLETIKNIRDTWVDFWAWLGDDPVLTPLFAWVSNTVQVYLVPPELQAGSEDWVMSEFVFASPILDNGQTVSLRVVTDARGVSNPWGLHGEQCYSCNGLKSWLGTDMLLPEGVYVKSPITGIIENIMIDGNDDPGGTSIWISSADVRFVLVNILPEDAAKFTPGQTIKAGDRIARPNGPHLHVILEVRNKNGTWADYPLAVLLSTTGTRYLWFTSQPPYFDKYVPDAQTVADRSDYIVKEAPIDK